MARKETPSIEIVETVEEVTVLEEQHFPVRTENEFALMAGSNMPNHQSSMVGLGKFVRSGTPTVPCFRTRQAAFRYAAWLLTLAETLPDEEGGHEFEDVLEAVQNS